VPEVKFPTAIKRPSFTENQLIDISRVSFSLKQIKNIPRDILPEADSPKSVHPTEHFLILTYTRARRVNVESVQRNGLK